MLTMGLAVRVLVLATAFFAGHAGACSCAAPPFDETEAQALERAWRSTPVIVEADFVSATITLAKGGVPIEDGVVRVRSSFKGPFKVGDLIRTRSIISGAACGWSLRGTPPAALEVGNKETRRLEPYWQWGAYDRWVLFLSGPAPYEVSTCSRSLPAGLSQDLPSLIQLKTRLQRP